jgi:hypothetical protein
VVVKTGPASGGCGRDERADHARGGTRERGQTRGNGAGDGAGPDQGRALDVPDQGRALNGAGPDQGRALDGAERPDQTRAALDGAGSQENQRQTEILMDRDWAETDGLDGAGPERWKNQGGHGGARRERTAVARTGTGDGGRGELAAAVTSRGSVGAGTLKPALIPC